MSGQEYYAVSPPGLEPVTAAELKALGAQGVEVRAGGVRFFGDNSTLIRANLWLRSASRVLAVAMRAEVRTFRELIAAGHKTPWDDFLVPGRGVNIRVACTRSRLYHERAVAERLYGLLGERPTGPESDAPLGVWVRIHDDVMTISLDASGELLHKRGYREDVGRAPIRENLAAGLLLAAGWTGETPLLDPMCGSGTFVAEAALIAAHRAPGLSREFAFESWPSLHPDIIAALRAEAAAAQRAIPEHVELVGVDRRPRAVASARANLERAGVSATIEVADADQLAATPGPAGLVITNPPYGRRIKAARAALQAFDALRERFPGWRFAVLYAKAGGVPDGWDEVARVKNGGIPVRLITIGPDEPAPDEPGPDEPGPEEPGSDEMGAAVAEPAEAYPSEAQEDTAAVLASERPTVELPAIDEESDV